MISMDKQYKTRNGRDVRLLCTDANGTFPVVGLITQTNGQQEAGCWTSTGGSWSDGSFSSSDLVEVKRTTVIQGVMFYYADEYGTLKAYAVTAGPLQDFYRQLWKQRNIKFTETPFKVEVEIP